MPRHIVIFAFMVFAVLAGCAVNPVTGRSELTLISEQEEISLGRKNYVPGQQQNGGQYILEPQLTVYVREVGRKIAQVSDRPHLPYEFVVLNDSSPNAWAMPGGKLALNRGLLTELKTEAELAAVLSHEIVHAAGRHAARGMENSLLLQTGAAVITAATSDKRYGGLIETVAGVGAGLLGIKYGRSLELEADHYGMIYMQRAGYDPKAAVALQETFVRLSENKEPNWLEGLFASHPPSRERVEENRKLAATLPAGRSGEQEYQAAIAPLLKSKPAYKNHDEGRKALQKKEYGQTLQLANAAIRIEPREALFYGLRGEAHERQGHLEEAEADYDEAVKRNPDFYAFYLSRGRLRQQRGDTEAALADFNRANGLLPTAQAHFAAGRILQGRGEQDQALRHYRMAAESEGEAGRQANIALARLELPRAPGRYFNVAVEQSGGKLALLVQNRAPVRVGGIAVEALHSAGARQTYRLSSLRPGETARIPLPWKPADLQAGARVGGEVISAHVQE